MFINYFRQQLADFLEKIADVLAADTHPTSGPIPLHIYIFVGDCYIRETRRFPTVEAAEEWLMWLDHYDRAHPSWSHGVIPCTAAVRFNTSTYPVEEFCQNWKGSFQNVYRTNGLEMWEFTPA